MKVYFAIPVASADVVRAGVTFARWREMGYQTAALIDGASPKPDNCEVIRVERYEGWAKSVNMLAKIVCHDADWIVSGGADMTCDPSKRAEVIAAEAVEHFGGTFGVLQPSGDKYGALARKFACVSPWLGREWCDRAYGGLGPIHAGYWHFWADTELRAVAEKCGRLWWRDDLTQYHDHWIRRGEAQPEYLNHAADANDRDKELFRVREAQGFPDSEPLAMVGA